MAVRNTGLWVFAAVAGVMLVASIVGVGWMGYGWSVVEEALGRTHAGDTTLEEMQVDLAQADAQRVALTKQIAEETVRLQMLGGRQRPVGRETLRQLQWEMLDLAAQCGLEVEEAARVGSDGRSVVVAKDDEDVPLGAPVRRGEVTLDRFSPDPKHPRPLVRFQGRGNFYQIRRFFARLGELRWDVTPASFEISRISSMGAASGTASADEATLRLTVVMAL